MNETVRNPRTGTVYTFPRHARRYLALCDRMNDARPCAEGHLNCAGWDGGPCADRVFSHHVAEPACPGGAR